MSGKQNSKDKIPSGLVSPCRLEFFSYLLAASLVIAGCGSSRHVDPALATSKLVVVEPSVGEPKVKELAPRKLHMNWEYEVTIDSAMRWLDVRVCFGERVPNYLRADHVAAIDALEFARWSDSKIDLPIDQERRRIQLTSANAGETRRGDQVGAVTRSGCVDYRSSIAKILSEGSGNRAFQQDRLAQLSAGLWVWRPLYMSLDAKIKMSFDLPEGLDVAVSWPPDPLLSRESGKISYLVDTTALRWLGWIVFGEFEKQRFRFEEVDYQVIILDKLDHLEADDVQTWIQESTAGVNALHGYSPISRAMILVAPSERRGDAVSFGMVGRGGGPAILLLVNRQAKLDQLRGNWNVIHEFLHLGMPFVQDPWLGEGFVSYYTEVMLTRLGHRSEEAGWIALNNAFGRGRRQSESKGQSIRFSSDHMRSGHAYYHVYWGGAAIAFMLDLEIRKDSQGRLTLDDAIRELYRCCANTQKKYRAKQLMHHLDEWYGKEIFTQLSAQVLESETFPDLRPAYRDLGIRWRDDTLSFDGSEDVSHLRSSIMGKQ